MVPSSCSPWAVPFCGAAGDLSPLDLIRISKFNKKELVEWGGQAREVFRNFDMTRVCQEIAERIADAVLRADTMKRENCLRRAKLFDQQDRYRDYTALYARLNGEESK